MVSRETILARTQYGVMIYCHILHGLYPNEVIMHQVGRDCGMVRNTFTDGEATLHVERVRLEPEKRLCDEIARHHDVNGGIPDGDCFDFAQLHYGLAGQELLNKINEEMFLHLEEGYSPYSPQGRGSEDVKPAAVYFSFFRSPITNVQPYKSITLMDAYRYITGNYAKARTEKLRRFSDPKRARNFKAANFDYCTFSGIFMMRNDKALVEHSGCCAWTLTICRMLRLYSGVCWRMSTLRRNCCSVAHRGRAEVDCDDKCG